MMSTKTEIVRYGGGSTAGAESYKRQQQALGAVAFKEGKPQRAGERIAHNGGNLVESSRAAETHQQIVRFGGTVYRITNALWAQHGEDATKLAARMAMVVTQMHPEDLRCPGEACRDLAVEQRARWYSTPGNEQHMEPVRRAQPIQPAPPAAGAAQAPAPQTTYEMVLLMPTPAERAAQDILGEKMPELERDRFTRDPAYHDYPDVGCVGYAALKALPFAQELRGMLEQYCKGRGFLELLESDERPTMDIVYWRLFNAVHAKPDISQTFGFLHIAPRAGEAMDEWTVRYFNEYKLCKDWVETTPQALTSNFLSGVEVIDRDVFSAVVNEANGAEIRVEDARDSTLRRWRAIQEIRKQRVLIVGPPTAQPQGGGRGRGGAGDGGEQSKLQQLTAMVADLQRAVGGAYGGGAGGSSRGWQPAAGGVPAVDHKPLCSTCGRHHTGLCFVDHPELLRDGYASWRPPPDAAVMARYVAACRRTGDVPRPQRGSTPNMALPGQQPQQQPLPVGGGGAWSARTGAWGGGAQGGRGGGRGNGQGGRGPSGDTRFNNAPPPPSYQQQPQAHLAQQGDAHSAQLAALTKLVEDLQRSQQGGGAWMPGAMMTRLQPTWPFAGSSTACVTTRAGQLAADLEAIRPPTTPSQLSFKSTARQQGPLPPSRTSRAQLHQAAAPGSGGLVPAVRLQPVHNSAHERLAVASAAASELHAAADAERSASRPLPVVQRRPQPIPFGTHALPEGLPASSLPTPVRNARAGSVAVPEAAPKELLEQLSSSPLVGRHADTGVVASFQSLIGLGTGVLEGIIGEGSPVVFQTPDGQHMTVPLGLLGVKLSFTKAAEVAAQLDQLEKAQQPVEELMQLPAAAAVVEAEPAVAVEPTVAAAAAPAVTEGRPPAAMLGVSGVGSRGDVGEEQCKSPELAGVGAGGSAEGGGGCQSDQQLQRDEALVPSDAELPPHLAGYAMVGGCIVAMSTAVPEVYTFPPGPPPQGLTLRGTPDGPALPFKRVVLDTGANVVLAAKQWVTDSKLPWQPTQSVQLQTSSGTSFRTAGRLSQPLIVVLCAGTPAEVKVAVDVHVMEEAQDVYQLLLGTPVINALGASFSAYESALVYRPQLRWAGGDPEVQQSIPICTYTNQAGPAYTESARFMLGAVSSWGGYRG